LPPNGLSPATLGDALKRLGFNATTHGMRSLLTDFGYDNGYLDVVVEAQLAHVWGALTRERPRDDGEPRGQMGGDAVRKAYLRSPFWSHRVNLLQYWADVCDHLKDGESNIVKLQAAA